MTATELITQFELQVDDMTELSDVEELSILNRVYRKVCNDRPWEFLKKNGTGVLALDATTGDYYVAIPEDFAYFIENENYTDNAIAFGGTASPRAILIGSSYQPYKIVNFSDRNQYRNHGGYGYIDWANNKIWFTGATNSQLAVGTAYSFDYVSTPTALTADTSPVFPSQFHEILVYGMAAENDIIQLSDKARSYQEQNEGRYQQYLADMAYWNAQQFNN